MIETPIIGVPTSTYFDLQAGAAHFGAAPWYLKALVALWDAGRWWGIDPVVMAAQCGKETGWGHFRGAVTGDMGNTCGLKIRNPMGDRKQDHATFPMTDGFPMVGAVAHAHHLRLYAGFPVPADTPDPRALYLGPGTPKFGTAPTVEKLGGAWAPSQTYGSEIVEIMARLRSGGAKI